MSSKVHYIHVRNRNQDGTISNRGGTTVAFREIPEVGIEYAYAFCSPKDNFSRHLGRTKAAGRLGSSRHRFVSVDQYDKFIQNQTRMLSNRLNQLLGSDMTKEQNLLESQ